MPFFDQEKVEEAVDIAVDAITRRARVLTQDAEISDLLLRIAAKVSPELLDEHNAFRSSEDCPPRRFSKALATAQLKRVRR